LPKPKGSIASSFAAIVYCSLDRHHQQTAKETADDDPAAFWIAATAELSP
jgi:hypothetical protein